ncbi:MAG: LL-diaminopimelate aminotransferase [Chlamydiales bacterium 38-26]|nr:LL-diaminopimelate aminotransferase [Chlamydiales bacterium]OJV08550.1 MAG: LL-diaminopimelate aminotransferase [Chlamydiales bacterium 38-26]
MVQRNPHLAKLKSGYLFPEIHKRKQQFLAQNPHAQLISLGVGDTTEPIPDIVSLAMAQEATRLSTPEGYSGYGPEQGLPELRKKVASKIYQDLIDPSEVFISDGAKCDIGRLQLLFGPHVSVAIQDPAYPVYVDGCIMQGVNEIFYMPCTADNDFFPDLDSTPRTDLIYFCSPNNPTGAVASRLQLEKLVQFAKKNCSIIIFDSAYACFIQDSSLPKSIFEIEGAREVAIEVNSFSKIAGFTGVRLGWTIVPKELKYADGTPVKNDWQRLTSTIFNGASNIAQYGGITALGDTGWEELNKTIHFYLENAALIKIALEKQGLHVFGGTHAPYLWVYYPKRLSWDVFQEILEKYHLVTTPGAGFGPSGEGFVRFTAFGHRETIKLATDRLNNKL